jgi:dephospho-CoA kinase
MPFIVGLTGGIGSGKSTVSDLFAERGAVIVDTDVIAHELTGARGAAMPAIEAAFGAEVLRADGGLDRKAMRQLVFANKAARRELEDILHPMIRGESDTRCRAATAAPYVMLVVPLFIESGVYRSRVARILVVDCDENIQIARVMARSGMTAEEVRAIMATQATRAGRLAAADDVVLNDGDLAQLADRIDVLHLRYLSLAAL